MSNACRVAVIGSGVSGLFFSATLCDIVTPLKLTVFEQGPEAHLRCGELNFNDSCGSCDPCTATAGLGGNALIRSTRLSTSPAGSGLISLLGTRYNSCEAEALRLWQSARYDNNSILVTDKWKRGYGAVPISKKAGLRLLHFLVNKVNHYGDVQCNEMVKTVQPEVGSWLIQTSGGQYRFDKIVMAGGKCSTLSLLDSLNSAGVHFAPGAFEYGCRVEFPTYPSKLASEVEVDNKKKLLLNRGISARTYCWSFPGRSVIVRNFNVNCLDGAHDGPGRGLSFAVLVRLHSLADGGQRFLRHIYNKQSSIFYGRPVSQSLASFLWDIPNTTKESQMYQSGSLKALFGNDLAEALRSALLHLNVHKWPGVEDALLYGPCIEKCCPIPVLKNNHESSVPNLFFIGDSSGIYRGALQASISGIDLAKNCIAR